VTRSVGKRWEQQQAASSGRKSGRSERRLARAELLEM
jgi:hypothetical protein